MSPTDSRPGNRFAEPVTAGGTAERLLHDYAAEIVETLREGLLLLDGELRVVAANRSFHEMFGLRGDAAVGRHLHLLGDGQWDLPALRQLLHALSSSTAVEGYEIDHVFPGVGRRVVLLNARKLAGTGDRGPLVLLAIADVTRQRQVERRLARHAHQLQRSNRELEEFAQVASHDLQEPLRKIHAFADLLMRDHGEQIPPEAHAHLHSILSAAERMRSLIRALLELARVAASSARFQVLDGGTLLRDVLADLQTSIAESGAVVDIGELPTLYGDADQLRQVLQNLVVNALKFHRPGSRPQVRVWGEQTPAGNGGAATTTLHVADQGIGFDEKYLGRIFLPFERLHARQKYPGTGIGLAIVSRVVERHGGTITARSAPDTGSTFTVTLPAGPPEEHPLDG